MPDLPVSLDHCVIHVSDWERARDFYTRVIGAKAIERHDGDAASTASSTHLRAASTYLVEAGLQHALGLGAASGLAPGA